MNGNKKEAYDKNAIYRGRVASVIFDPDVMEQTEKLRGEVPRTRWVNHALREYNKRQAEIKQRVTELKEDVRKNEQEINALLQNHSPSTVSSQEEECSARMGFFSSSSSLYPSSTRQTKTINVPRGTGDPEVG